MFKKLKEKIAEEVKPLKISQFAQSVGAPGNNAVVDSPPTEPFSLDDELPEDSFGNEGFSIVDLRHPSLPVPLSSGRFSRQSSMSSLASDASAFLPIHDGTFNMQDLESASEREDVLPQMNSLSKQELCNSYLKLYRHYQKYKGRAADLKNFCTELEKDNKKYKTVLLECQEKSLRRIAELKEQCALEQHAKAHLEEALRNDLEEKDHLIQTLQTKIKFLKDAYSANSSVLVRLEDENLFLTSGEIDEDYKSDLSILKDDFQTPQGPLTETVSEMKSESSCEESKMMALKNRFDNLKEQILKDSSGYIQDLPIEFQDILNEISGCLSNTVLYCTSSNTVDKTFHISESDERNSNLLLLGQLEQTVSQSEEPNSNDSQLNSTTALKNVPSYTQNVVHISNRGTCAKIEGSAVANSVSDLTELKNELKDLKTKFETATQELPLSHQLISKQNSTITKLNEQLAILQSDFAAYDEIENIETVKSDLMQSKKELERVYQQILITQQTIEEKDRIIKETKDTLVKIRQELNNVLAEKTDMAKKLITVQLELTNMKSSYKELTHKLLNGREETLKKESIIDHLKKEIEKVRKELELTTSDNNEGNEVVRSLENVSKETKLKYEHITKELELQTTLVEEKDLIVNTIKRDLSHLQKDLDKVSSEKDEQNKVDSALGAELKDIILRFEETTKEIESFNVLLKEKNDLINKTNEELTLVHQELDAASHEKGATALLQNQLADANLQLEKMRHKLTSTQENIDSKDSEIVTVRASLKSVQGDMEIVSTRVNEKNNVLENKLLSSKSQIEESIQKLEDANKLLGEKDNEIVNSWQDLENIKKEMNVVLSQNIEKVSSSQKTIEELIQKLDGANKLIDKKDNEIVNSRQDLENIKKEMEVMLSQNDEKVSSLQNTIEVLVRKLDDANKLIDKKDNEIVNSRQDLENIKEEMEVVSSQNVEKSKMVKELENDLTDAKVQLSKVIHEINDLHKLIQEKDIQITSINNELVAVHKNFEITLSQRTEAYEMKECLEEKLANVNGFLELMTQDLQSARNLLDEKDSNYADVCEKLSDILKELDTAVSEKAKAEGKVADLQNELINMSDNFMELTEELQSSSKLLVERDLKISCLTEDATNIHEALDKTSAEKEEFIEKLFSLKKELTTTKLQFEQMSQEVQSANHATKEKDLTVAHLTAKVGNLQRDLDIISLQKTEAFGLVKDLQEELKRVSLNFEHVSQDLQEVNELIQRKDLIITNLTTDLTKTNNELASTSALKDESCELVTTLQNELRNSKLCCDKMSEELETTLKLLEDKDLHVEQLKNELVKTQEELNKSCILKSEANKNVEALQAELTQTKINLKSISSESTNQFLGEKKLESDVTGNVGDTEDIMTDLAEETPKLVAVLQRKLESIEQELESVVAELVTSQRRIEERDTLIKKLEQELADMHKKFKMSDNEYNTDLISRVKLHNPIILENSAHIIQSNLNNNQTYSCSSTVSSVQSCVDNYELCSKNTWRKYSDELDFKMKTDGTVLCSNDWKRNNMKRQECSGSDTSLFPVDKTNPSGQDKTIASSDGAVIHSVCASQIANSIESSFVSENYSVSESSEKPYRLRGESIDNLGGNKKRLQNDLELSWTNADSPIVKQSTSRNAQEAPPTTGHGDKHVKDIEFSSIQNILDEIQKENKEYGSLLDCHKNIINYLEGITKLQHEEIQPGSAEWLHKQLVILCKKLYETKEKQSIQIASINRLVEHQQDIMKSDDHKNNMTIEMQYLRNIVFQYMIGKETMLLAKVISAVMKFDQQQMDQVMQKELQKQTLLGQLGLL